MFACLTFGRLTHWFFYSAYGVLALHDGFALLRRSRRIELGDAERSQHGSGALCAAGDGALEGAVAEVDVDHADGPESGQRLSGGEVEACGFELPFDCAVEQEGQRRDIDVSVHAVVGAVIDRSQVEDILQVGEGSFDFRQILVESHGVDSGQSGLLGLDDILSLLSLLAREVDGMLEEAEVAVLISPIIIAMTVIAREYPGRSSPDLLGRLEASVGDTSREFLKPGAHALHRLHALAALEGLPFFGMDDEDPHTGRLGDDLLNLRFGWRRLLARRDADRTLDPGTGRALDVVEHFSAATAIAADDVTMAMASQQIEIVGCHHAAVTDEYHALESEASFEITQHLGHRLGVTPVALEDVMGERPAVDHNQADQHLRVARLVITTVAMGALLGWTSALEVSRRQIVEPHVHLQ